jgi:fumarate reductase subunit D
MFSRKNSDSVPGVSPLSVALHRVQSEIHTIKVILIAATIGLFALAAAVACLTWVVSGNV